MRANCHTHTRWCKHGTGEIEDYIETAIQGRIQIIKGLECEYYPDELDHYRTLRDTYGYELLILGPALRADNAAERFAEELGIEVMEVLR